jgi:E3 ubiquitin-protein ligase SHPRH
MPPKKRVYKEEDEDENKENAGLVPKKIIKKSKQTTASNILTTASVNFSSQDTDMTDTNYQDTAPSFIDAPKEILTENGSYIKIDSLHPTLSDKDWQNYSIGEYKLKFKSKNSFKLENCQFFLYKSSNSDKTKSRVMNDLNFHQYYLYVAANSNDIYELVQILEPDCIQKQLIELLGEKCLKLSVGSIAKAKASTNTHVICVDVLLTKKLNNQSLSSSPCDYYRNISYSQAITNIMNHLYFIKRSQTSELKFLSEGFACDHDDLPEDQMVSSDDYKSAQEILFELVHTLNNQFNSASERDIDMIQEQSCLMPVLRKYQINAVKWMLQRENFSLKSIGLANADDDEATMISESHPPPTDDLHPLFLKVVNKDSRTIYFHKFFGLFTTIAPFREQSRSGGILADEMGLGKTLEVLATILINPRSIQIEDLIDNTIQTKLDASQQAPTRKESKSVNAAARSSGFGKAFSCICGNRPDEFKTQMEKIMDDENELEKEEEEEICSQKKSKSKTIDKKRKKPVRRFHYNFNNVATVSTASLACYQCVLCDVWTHIKCVSYTGSETTFICLSCHEKIPPLKSSCTLIVTPSIISQQWIDEINKHANTHKKLKVLFYKGATKGFVQPRDLAQLDICITTYDVLNDELAHVFALDNAKVLRQPKRFMNVSSPLLYVEWWRICLDEAQMVHSTNTRCAAMANRLNAINRWCITGTPIGRSLADLHGLFTFIRQEPYCEKRWFDELLLQPFNSGSDKTSMALEVSKVLWRTTKNFVQDQIQLPEKTEKVYRLKFSPFELHLYERVREDFRITYNVNKSLTAQAHSTAVSSYYANRVVRQKNINDYNPNLRLDELDRTMLNQILAPLLDLRITCNHPQLILRKSHFMHQPKDKKDKLLSMEKSLELLLKKTSGEAEKLHQSLIASSISIAGVIFEQGKYEEVVELYESFLDSEKDLKKHDINLNNMQLISIFFNLIEAQQKLNKNYVDPNNNLTPVANAKPTKDKVTLLTNKLKECEAKHLKSFEENKLTEEQALTKMLENDSLLFQAKTYAQNHLGHLEYILDHVELKSSVCAEFWRKLTFTNRKVQILENGTVADNVWVYNQVVESVSQLKGILMSELEKLLQSRTNTIDMMLGFFDKRTKLVIKNTKLISFEKKKLWNTGITKEIVDESTHCHLRASMSALKLKKCSLCQVDQALSEYANLFDLTSDLETVLKISAELGLKADPLTELCHDLKDEHDQLNKYFQSVSSLVKAHDEVEAAKTQQVKAQQISPEFTQQRLWQQQTQKKDAETKFRKKLNQIIYLKNLEKTYKMEDGEENKDECPICQECFGFEWYILSCGHLMCKDCNLSMMRASENPNYLRCAMCREVCLHSDSYLVSTRINNQENDEQPQQPTEDSEVNSAEVELNDVQVIGGYNSAKIEGVVKCIVKIQRSRLNGHKPKCIVFSEHPIILDIIKSFLNENKIKSCVIRNLTQFEKSIEDFKKDSSVNVLLMPYSYGANGLNLIEATHVVLVEPTLNKSQEAQAIGRIHRIGQTKPTFVHRFIVRNTVEEQVFNLFKETSSAQAEDRRMLKVGDVISLFNNL